MSRPSGNVDHMAALGGGGAGVPQSPPSSAWSVLAAHADEDDGLEEGWDRPRRWRRLARSVGSRAARDSLGACGRSSGFFASRTRPVRIPRARPRPGWDGAAVDPHPLRRLPRRSAGSVRSWAPRRLRARRCRFRARRSDRGADRVGVARESDDRSCRHAMHGRCRGGHGATGASTTDDAGRSGRELRRWGRSAPDGWTLRRPAMGWSGRCSSPPTIPAPACGCPRTGACGCTPPRGLRRRDPSRTSRR